jgi:hypothetical protein
MLYVYAYAYAFQYCTRNFCRGRPTEGFVVPGGVWFFSLIVILDAPTDGGTLKEKPKYRNVLLVALPA